ncbi:DUF4942 domain-containing protein [Rhodococcus sp. NPDC059969]|uniref:DUF4942 domain-containing protein n=1 Tax=Rhodococcus sp. NPDC059969 TaxID=3347018 RepID=UPI0036702DAC
MADIGKGFAYLDGKVFEPELISSVLEETKRTGESRNVDTPHLVASFYKKGTTHIVFKDADLLKKFKYIGSQRRGWLPPNYGKKSYTAMTSDERAVVDDFEGAEAYAETVQRIEFYESRPAMGWALGSNYYILRWWFPLPALFHLGKLPASALVPGHRVVLFHATHVSRPRDAVLALLLQLAEYAEDLVGEPRYGGLVVRRGKRLVSMK